MYLFFIQMCSISSVTAESNRKDSYLRVELVGNNWNEIHTGYEIVG